MTAAQRIAAFIVGLAAVFAVAVWVGKTVGPEIGFHTTIPSAGDYRLFLDFQHRGVVRTAEFTVSVDDGRSAPAAEHTPAGHGH
jgi:hypothetical protein